MLQYDLLIKEHYIRVYNKFQDKFLDTFGTKSSKNVPISFAVSVCPHVTTQELLNGFS
jgi:hypothetical protein